MTQLGNGLYAANCHEDALSVGEAELSMLRRLGASEQNILDVQANLAITYTSLGRDEEALRLKQEIYSGRLKLKGIEHLDTNRDAINYATSLITLGRFEEAKALLRKTAPVARRVFGESNNLTLKMRGLHATVLSVDPDATLADLREAVATLGDSERIARRVFGGAHPFLRQVEQDLRRSQAILHARETPPTSG